MGEYGEPWSTQTVAWLSDGTPVCPIEGEDGDLYSGSERDHEIITSEGDSILVVADDADVDYRFRAIACVNVLDGVPDEAIPHIRAAIVGLLNNLPIVTMEHLTQARKMMEVPR